MTGFAMLCRKAWRESRGRFVIGAIVVGGLCAGLILLHTVFRTRIAAAGGAPVASFADYAVSRIYGSVVRALFVIVVILLGLGGLQAERAQRTIGFSLALPVRRAHHVAARALVGVLEVAALAALPVVIVPGCAAAVGEHVALAQAAGYAVLWLAVGAVMFAASIVVSSVVRNDYAALALAMVGLRVVPRALAGAGPWLQPDRLMTGRGLAYADPHTGWLIGTPWLVIGSALGVAAGLLAIAAWLTERERFV